MTGRKLPIIALVTALLSLGLASDGSTSGRHYRRHHRVVKHHVVTHHVVAHHIVKNRRVMTCVAHYRVVHRRHFRAITPEIVEPAIVSVETPAAPLPTPSPEPAPLPEPMP